MSKFTLFFLCAFVAFLPFEMMASFETLPSGAKMVGVACVIAALFAFLAGYQPRLLSPVMNWRMLLTIWSFLSVLWSFSPEVTSDVMKRMAQLVVFVLLVWEFSVSYRDQLWLFRSLVFGMLVPLGMQLATFGGLSRSADQSENMRYSGGGHDPNYLALMFAVSVVVGIYLATNPSKLERTFRWGYWGYVAAATLGTLLTASRGGFFCLIVAGTFGLLIAGVTISRILRLLKFGVPMLITAFALYKVVPAALESRLTELGGADTFALRWGYWFRGITYSFASNPLMGVGLGAYSEATTALSGVKTGVAHNVGMSVLVELGIIGFCLFLAYIYSMYRAAWRMPSREKWLSVGLLTVWLVGAMSSGSQIDKFSWFVHAMVATMAAACMQMQRQQRAWPQGVPTFGQPVVGRQIRRRLGGH